LLSLSNHHYSKKKSKNSALNESDLLKNKHIVSLLFKYSMLKFILKNQLS